MPDNWQQLNHDIELCERCPRLREHCTEVARVKRRAFAEWNYWGRPVPNFGDARARFLIVGLAPAAHGANRTGRMFTGDRSGEWLYRALHTAGFASQAEADSAEDGLQLFDCAITATCHCAPPDNKPERDEMANCREYLTRTFALLPVEVILALGQIGWRAVIDHARDAGWWQGAIPKFGHVASVEFANGMILLGSFHPSQQNTFTGKLTQPMFDQIFARVRAELDRR